MVDELVERISEESGEPEEEIRERVAAKVEELSGLVSEEGAAHLVAREEGIELAEAGDKELTVDNIVPGMNRVDLKCKVVDVGEVNTFERDGDEEQGRVRNVVLGDSTGTIRMTLWDDQTDVGEKLEEGESIHVKGAYSKEDNRGNVELRVGDSTQMEILEEDVGEVEEAPSSSGHSRVNIDRITGENMNYEIQGTVLELYTDSPFYKSCPECRKKVEEKGGDWTCDEHGEVEPEDSLILSAIIDDGYGNVRTVFFRDTARGLLRADEELDGDAEAVEEKAEKVRGEEVVVRGRSRYNDFFNRTELIGNEVEFLDSRELVEEKLAGVE